MLLNISCLMGNVPSTTVTLTIETMAFDQFHLKKKLHDLDHLVIVTDVWLSP